MRWFGARRLPGMAVVLIGLGAHSCAVMEDGTGSAGLRETAGLIAEVKTFGKTLGIEPTEALGRTARQETALSMLWLWMQRNGTLAVVAPMDIRLAIGYGAGKERLKIEQVYRVDRYSVYYRQGSEFADPRSAATVGFSEEPMLRRVKVVLHEDLHGDVNFDLPWEIEEAIVTPLGALAAVEYFRWKGDRKNLQNALVSVGETRQMARELNALVARAEIIFADVKDHDAAKQKVLALLPEYPSYREQFERQLRRQHTPTALEAKLSHDLAYYRYFDRVAGLAEKAPSLGTLIADLKGLPRQVTAPEADRFLENLRFKYDGANR